MSDSRRLKLSKEDDMKSRIFLVNGVFYCDDTEMLTDYINLVVDGGNPNRVEVANFTDKYDLFISGNADGRCFIHKIGPTTIHSSRELIVVYTARYSSGVSGNSYTSYTTLNKSTEIKPISEMSL